MPNLYNRVMNAIDNIVPKPLRPFWVHPAGPKTIFFWAPITKWGLVIAGLGDIFNRPPEKISIPQSTALAATGCIWARYSMVIIPVNVNLCAVNVCVAFTNLYLIFKSIRYKQEKEGQAKENTKPKK